MAGRIARAPTFASLRLHRNYRLFFTGQVVSVSGTWMQNVAQAWLVLQLTGSPEAVGILAAFQFGPYALLGLAGGVIADRVDRRRLLIATQSLPILLAGSLAALAFSGRATVWEVDLLAALNGLIQCVDTPARQAFVVEMVGRHELRNAIALNSSLFNASRIIGPGLGGLVIGAFGVGLCFALNALSYVAVVAVLLLMDPSRLHRAAPGERPPVLRGIAEGIAYAARTPTVRVVLLMMLAVGTISINFQVILPVVAEQTLHSGASVLGLLSACFGLGALAGALLSASLARADFRLLCAGGLGLGLSELLLAPQTSVPVAAALLLVVGLTFSTYASNTNATIQLAVPDALRGRVLSLYGYVFFGTAPLGGSLAGWLSARGGTQLALGVAGAVATVVPILGGLWYLRGSGAPRRDRGPAPPLEPDSLSAA